MPTQTTRHLVAYKSGHRRFLRLDRLGVAQYVCLHGVCFPFISCLGRESHHRWLGTVHAAQPTFTPESRHRFHFHHQPYCLGIVCTPHKIQHQGCWIGFRISSRSSACCFARLISRSVPVCFFIHLTDSFSIILMQLQASLRSRRCSALCPVWSLFGIEVEAGW